MSRDITVYKTPALDLPLDELVSRLQEKFAAEGMLDGLIHATVNREVEHELDVNRQVFRQILIDNWETFFPGVSIIDVDLDAELSNFIAEKRPLIAAILHDYVLKRAVVAGTPSLNLLLSAEMVQRTTEFPCEGKPHEFSPKKINYSSFIISKNGATHYDNVWWPFRSTLRDENTLYIFARTHSKKCGRLRRKVSVSVFHCANTHCNIVKLQGAWFSYYCESCGATGKMKWIWKPRTSAHILQLLMSHGLALYHR